MIIGIISWIISSIIVGIIGSNRKIGFAGAFFLSLLLSPLIGLIFTFFSKSLEAEKFEQELLQTQKMQQKTMEKIMNQNINTVAEDLKKIKDLLDNGIINSDDYEKIKTKIINKYEGLESAESQEENSINLENINLTESEKDKVRKLSTNLQNGEAITFHQVNKKIEIMSLKQCDEWKKLYGENILKILVKKE